MDYERELRDTGELIETGKYKQAVNTAGSAVEALLKDLYKELTTVLSGPEGARIQAALQAKHRDVKKVTFGQWVGFFGAEDLFRMLNDKLKYKLRFLDRGTLAKVVEIRNDCIHEDYTPLRSDAETVRQFLAQYLIETGRVIGALVILLMLAGIAASVFQNAPGFVAERIRPKASNISIAKGWSRLFGAKGWVEFGKSMMKLLLAVAVLKSFGAWLDKRRELRGESLPSAVFGYLRSTGAGMWAFLRGTDVRGQLATEGGTVVLDDPRSETAAPKRRSRAKKAFDPENPEGLPELDEDELEDDFEEELEEDEEFGEDLDEETLEELEAEERAERVNAGLGTCLLYTSDAADE